MIGYLIKSTFDNDPNYICDYIENIKRSYFNTKMIYTSTINVVGSTLTFKQSILYTDIFGEN